MSYITCVVLVSCTYVVTNFAHIFYLLKSTHTWDPLIKGTVQYYYEDIIQRRMKDMVSNARTSTEQPSWIKDTIWKVMVDYWELKKQFRGVVHIPNFVCLIVVALVLTSTYLV